jgi:hypothetical protein
LLAICLTLGKTTQDTNQDNPIVARKIPAKPHPLEPVCFIKHGPKESDGPVASILQVQPAGDTVAGDAKPLCTEVPRPVPANQPEINAAIAKGVAYFMDRLNDKGTMPGDNLSTRLGGFALIGMTLVSCGVPADDAKVATILARVRVEASACVQTYDLAICIWLLDTCGVAGDRELIRSMALRLIAGQNIQGGWAYTCPFLQPPEEQELLRLLEDHPYEPLPVIVQGDANKAIPAKRPPVQAGNKYPALQFQPGNKLTTVFQGDNSNTQFAALGLWTAQKYHVPAQRSLAMLEARFRQSQVDDGTWGYHGPHIWPDSMTCAGLIGLAVGHGLTQATSVAQRLEDQQLAKDPQIAKGLVYLGNRLPQLHDALRRGQWAQAKSHGGLYFLWSLERVAVIYDLDTIGGKDWYAWGSDILLANQLTNGSWRDNHGEAVDTCFALLFLKRVNVAHDLTKLLTGLGGARDPGAPPGARSHVANYSLSEIKDEPDIAPGRIKTRTGYKTPSS